MKGKWRRVIEGTLIGFIFTLTYDALLNNIPDISVTLPETASLKRNCLQNYRREPLYIGVLSAGKYLETRGASVIRTWGKYAPRIDIFTGHFPSSKQETISHIKLPANDSQYPPVDKTFYMLMNTCRHHLDSFDWFMRADDDVYVKIDKLLPLLRSLDKTSMIYLGQPGLGKADVFKNKLEGHSYCMGGPGVIISRVLLKALCPYLQECHQAAVSGEDDVELGVCIYKHLGISCTQDKKTLSKIFSHTYPQQKKQSRSTVSAYRPAVYDEFATTLHPAKDAEAMNALLGHHLRSQISSIKQDMDQMSTSLASSTTLCAVKNNQLTEKKDWPMGVLVCNDSTIALLKTTKIENLGGTLHIPIVTHSIKSVGVKIGNNCTLDIITFTTENGPTKLRISWSYLERQKLSYDSSELFTPAVGFFLCRL